MLTLAERIVDDEDMDAAVVGDIRRTFDLVDTRMMVSECEGLAS